MRHSLLIRPHQDPNQVSWAIFNNKGQILDSAFNVPIATVPKHPAWVLIPGTDVLLTQAEIPSKQRQRIIQAVPYALEDQLIDDIENLHFAVGRREPASGLIAVAVLARTQMETYLQSLHLAGIMPTVLMPDILAVPKPDDGWGMLFFDNIVLVRTGLHTGFAIELPSLETVLQMALQNAQPPSQLTVFKGPQPIDTLRDLQTLGIPILENTNDSGELAWLAQGLLANPPLNLLQGDYRPVDKIITLWRPWRLTGALLTLWGGLLLGEEWLKYQQLRQLSQALNVTIEQIYRDTFPQARKIVNPRVQMEQQLKSLRAQQTSTTQRENFLSLLTQLSTPFKQTAGLEVKRIDYQPGVFNIELLVPHWQALEQFKQNLTTVGFSAKIQTATNRNNRIESRLRVEKTMNNE
jgi:general secretion pathway protein L